MNRTSKLIAGAVLCAGLVQLTSARNVTMKVVKQDPGMELFYGVETVAKPGRVGYQQLTKDSIKFDDKKTQRLFFSMSEEGQDSRSLLVEENQSLGKGDSEVVIIINTAGMPRYGTMKEVELYKQQSKTKPKQQRG